MNKPLICQILSPSISLLIVLLTGSTPAHSEVLWYGGDIDPNGGAINNSRITAIYGSNVLDDFVVTDTSGWHVTGLFSNNIADYPIEMYPFTEAVWSIRTGVATGEFGNFLFSGVSPVTVTPTGRTWGERLEYTIAVNNLSLDLSPGSYFMSVSPLPEFGIYYVGYSNGEGAVGTAGISGVLAENRYVVDGAPQNSMWEYDVPRASMGVIGSVKQEGVEVPEPNTLSLLSGVLVGLFFLRGCRDAFQGKHIKCQ